MKTFTPGMTRALSWPLGLVITALFSSSLMAVDCTSANITLNEQTEVDNFQTNYGGGGTCDTVTGNLTVDGDDIDNLSPLSALTSVGGILYIVDNAALANLDGLSALTSVGGISINGNAALANLDGLSALTSVSEHLNIWGGNAALTNIDGLSALTSVGGNLDIGFNAALVNLDGLSALTGTIESLNIRDNAALTNIDGLSALTSMGDLNIEHNAALASINGLSALTSVDRWFFISSNTTLANLDSLSVLASVGWDLKIAENAALANIDGLSSLISVGDDVELNNNPSLAICTGLIALLDYVDDGAPGPGPGAAGIPDVADDVTMLGNLSGCNSVTEIFADAPLMKINAGLNDAWLNLETDGQGFFIIVFPEIEQIFLAWFTYDTQRPPEDVTAMLGDPGHRWITAQGDYVDNEALLEVWVTQGGVFDSEEPTPDRYQDGEMLLEFSTCNAGTVTYDIPSIDRQGVVPIERITLDNVPLCYMLGNQAIAEATLHGD